MESDEERYRRYVDRKWFSGQRARMPKDYLRERDRWTKSRDFGNVFRDGMCQLLGRTEDRGWQKERYYRTKRGARFHDSASARERHAMEFKAGEVRRDALDQLAKDTQALRDGWVVEWYTVEGAKIDNQVAAKMKELQARYPGSFLAVTVTREMFSQAIELGKQRGLDRRQQPAKTPEQARDRPHDQAEAKRVEREHAEIRAVQTQMKSMLQLHAQQGQREPQVEQHRESEAARDVARVASEAAERAERIACAQHDGIPPEIARLLALSHAEPPSAATRLSARETPRVTRGGHALDRARERDQGRER
ncbi:hypothetical protein [Nocardia farcinica]|uniref:hypothetical protein n=1 Tax=Nocardia farcinica TaxID=37329 RepID=UPI003799B077